MKFLILVWGGGGQSFYRGQSEQTSQSADNWNKELTYRFEGRSGPDELQYNIMGVSLHFRRQSTLHHNLKHHAQVRVRKNNKYHLNLGKKTARCWMLTVDPSPRNQGPSLALTHLVQFVSLRSDVVHQDLVGRQLILYWSPGVLGLLQPHPTPQLVDHLHPQPRPVLDVELAQLAVLLHLGLAAGDLLHEGGQLHGLADQGPADCSEMGVRLGGKSQVMSAM